LNETPMLLRNARIEDAVALAELTNLAGEGLPLYLWQKLAAAGETAWEVGLRRARREEGSFSYRNATVAEIGGKIAACLIGYPLPEAPQAIDYASMPAMFVPLQELENLGPGSWYVNVLATYPPQRGKGIGSRLLDFAETLAARTARRGMSIIVSDDNKGARRLYRRRGYAERASRPMVKEGWESRGENWLLLVKDGA
jgi:ribosomal protein S18 acetylase RimI-like enzyme